MQRARRRRLEISLDLQRRLGLGLAGNANLPYLRLPVFAPTRADKRRLLEEGRRHGLGITAGYPTTINEIPEIAALFTGQRFPHASLTAAHLLTIPTHHWLTDADTHAIASHVAGKVRESCPVETGDLDVTTQPHNRTGVQVTTPA
jgi:hypothetical protein